MSGHRPSRNWEGPKKAGAKSRGRTRRFFCFYTSSRTEILRSVSPRWRKRAGPTLTQDDAIKNLFLLIFAQPWRLCHPLRPAAEEDVEFEARVRWEQVVHLLQALGHGGRSQQRI